MAEKKATVVAKNEISEDQLRKVTSFADAMKLTAEVHGAVVSVADTMGDGFTVLDTDQKARLVGVEMLFMDWDFQFGDYNAQYVSARVCTAAGDKYRINDGSTGLCAQLQAFTREHGAQGGLYAKHGLTESTYETCVGCNKPHPLREDECGNCGNTETRRAKGTTYYIDLSA